MTQKIAISAPSHNVVWLYLKFNIKAKGPEGHKHCSTQYKFKKNSTWLLTKATYYRVTIAKMFDTTKM